MLNPVTMNIFSMVSCSQFQVLHTDWPGYDVKNGYFIEIHGIDPK